MGSIKDEDEEDEDDTGDDYSDDEGGSNGGLSRKQRECSVLGQGVQGHCLSQLPSCKRHPTSPGTSCKAAIRYDPREATSLSMSSLCQDHQRWALMCWGKADQWSPCLVQPQCASMSVWGRGPCPVSSVSTECLAALHCLGLGELRCMKSLWDRCVKHWGFAHLLVFTLCMSFVLGSGLAYPRQ